MRAIVTRLQFELIDAERVFGLVKIDGIVPVWLFKGELVFGILLLFWFFLWRRRSEYEVGVDFLLPGLWMLIEYYLWLLFLCRDLFSLYFLGINDIGDVYDVILLLLLDYIVPDIH